MEDGGGRDLWRPEAANAADAAAVASRTAHAPGKARVPGGMTPTLPAIGTVSPYSAAGPDTPRAGSSQPPSPVEAREGVPPRDASPAGPLLGQEELGGAPAAVGSGAAAPGAHREASMAANRVMDAAIAMLALEERPPEASAAGPAGPAGPRSPLPAHLLVQPQGHEETPTGDPTLVAPPPSEVLQQLQPLELSLRQGSGPAQLAGAPELEPLSGDHAPAAAAPPPAVALAPLAAAVEQMEAASQEAAAPLPAEAEAAAEFSPEVQQAEQQEAAEAESEAFGASFQPQQYQAAVSPTGRAAAAAAAASGPGAERGGGSSGGSPPLPALPLSPTLAQAEAAAEAFLAEPLRADPQLQLLDQLLEGGGEEHYGAGGL